ncbi:MAG: PAS domain S-box protein, partial [Xanthobacteraceae bacterium]
SIDSRSDLYALGVTFYQMLTARLPFSAADPMEWVHCHIARTPLAPAERLESIPALISEIVMKLLAKTAEERYQTAAGVENDLRRCLAEWERHERIETFALGERDQPDRLLIPEKLHGRVREVETLLAAFDRVVESGATELVLVSGYSGIGKSSVVNELHKALVPPRGLFAAGKFDQYKRDIPYATLVQAFQSLVRPLLGKNEADLAPWRDALLEALGPNGRLMADVVPELRLIIGEQPPVPELPPQDAQRRFHLVLRRFIGVFARPEHPLALFLDDLQWIDAATLDLLQDLLTQADVRRLLLIGAYCDNEVTAAHPLMQKLSPIKSAGGKVAEITLAPLAREHLGQLIADALRCEPERAVPLAQLVHEKTAGNPFFAIQFLSSLADEGLLAFDHEARRWSWDVDRIQAKGYADNVADLMVGKLARLPPETQKALQVFACLGNVADLTTLAIMLGTTEDEVHRALWEAVRLELVERSPSLYRFVHDRVQEAAYSLIPENQRAAAHLRIGRLLVARTPPENREEAIFEIVNQLNRGAALITAEEEREQLAELNLIAGKRAKAATTYLSACRYLAAAMASLGQQGWRDCYELTFSVWFERAECEVLNSNFGEADHWIQELLLRAQPKVDRAHAYQLRMVLQLVHGDNADAVRTASECLQIFGFELPERPTDDQVRAEYDAVWSNLGAHPIGSLLSLPMMEDPEMRAVMNVFSALCLSAYFTDGNLCQTIACRMVSVTQKYGTTDSAVVAYGVLSIFLGPVFHRYRDGEAFARLAVTVAEKRGFPTQKAGANFVMQMAVLWTQPIEVALTCLDDAISSARETGEVIYACYSVEHRITDLMVRGDHLDAVWLESVKALEFVERVKFRHVCDILSSIQHFVQGLRGQAAGAAVVDETALEARLLEGGIALVICFHWILQIQLQLLIGDPETAVEYAEKAKPLLWSARCHIQFANYVFYYSLALAAVCSKASREKQADIRSELAANVQTFERWAQSCPMTFGHKRLLLCGELARLEGRDIEAMELYEQAIRSARANGFIHIEALAYELAARFYAARGFEDFEYLYLRKARAAYLRWGADGKVRQLDQLYPHLKREELAPAPTSMIGAPVETLDLATVIKVSQAISGEIVVEKLVDTLMRTALEQAGAGRGVLALMRGDRLQIAADALTEGDRVIVNLRDDPATAEVLPESLLQYVLRTRESVVLDDSAVDSAFAADPYFYERRVRSVLCLPLVNQAKLIGALYLENDLAPRVFARPRIAALKLLASQAAISLENTRLYRELSEREAKIRRLVDANIIGIFTWELSHDGPYADDPFYLDANDAFLRIVGYEREEFVSRRMRRSEFTPPGWRERDKRTLAELREFGVAQPYEKEYFRKDRSRVPVLLGVACYDEERTRGVGFVLDLTERKRAESELRIVAEQNAVLANALNRSHEGAYLVDASGRFLYVNDEACHSLGYSREELLAMSVPDIDPEFPRERIVAALRRTLDEGPLTFETFHKSKDGRLFPVEITLSAFDNNASSDNFIALARNISERKRDEEALRASEEQWKAVFENNPTMYFMVDATGAILSVNPFGAEQLGYTADELIGRPVKILFHEADRERGLRNKAICLEHLGQTMSWELRKLRKDGESLWVRETARAMLIKDRPIVLFACEDITDRKRAEAALRASEEQWKAVFENSPTMYFMVDPSNTIISVNPFGAEQLGYATNELIGRPIQILIHEADRERAMRNKAICLKNVGQTTSWELRKLRKDGEALWVRETARAMLINNRSVLLVVSEDITKVKRATEALRVVQTELAHANRVAALGQLAASIAHEVNQPVTGVLSSGNAALRWLDMSDLGAARRAIERVIRDAIRAGDVIGGLRALVKKAPPRTEFFDLNKAIREVIVITRAEAETNGVSVEAQLANNLPLIRGDRVQLQQVFLNLIINAIEAMSGVAEGPRELIVKTAKSEPDSVSVAVQDSGPGLDPADSSRAFEDFYTTKPNGLGIGLSICRSIVEAHGGKLAVTANAPRGAILQFTLPVRESGS